MSDTLLAKLAQKKYEKKRKKVEEFLNTFRDENIIRIKEVHNHNKDELIKEVEEIIYRKQNLMTPNEIVKLLVLTDKLKK